LLEISYFLVTLAALSALITLCFFYAKALYLYNSKRTGSKGSIVKVYAVSEASTLATRLYSTKYLWISWLASNASLALYRRVVQLLFLYSTLSPIAWLGPLGRGFSRASVELTAWSSVLLARLSTVARDSRVYSSLILCLLPAVDSLVLLGL
jgi:hypothetical protein